MNIQKKLMIIMLFITVAPLSFLGYFALSDAKHIGYGAAENAKSMGEQAAAQSISNLNSLGENIIKQKAVDVAKQLEVFIKSNPAKTVADLQADEYFKQLAVQKVGETGYTAVTDVSTLICRFHSNPKIVNMDLHNLAEKLPGFWGIMSQSQGGKEVFGYYDWQEADGSMKQKYMHIAIVGAATADNVVFSVAATTYIDEFSKPVNELKANLDQNLDNTLATIKNSTEGINTDNTILFVTIISALLAILISIIFARNISRPIIMLKDAADKATSGEFDVKLPEAKSTDEVSKLIGSFEMLIIALKRKKE
jgi:methyl-accepting chemotaxis protein